MVVHVLCVTIVPPIVGKYAQMLLHCLLEMVHELKCRVVSISDGDYIKVAL